MSRTRSRRLRHGAAALLAATGTALVVAGAASAHAEISPGVFQAGEGREFVLTVPNEKENPTTTSVELTPPSGFQIFSFAPTPGWERQAETTGSGEEESVTRVTWSGGSIPAGEYGQFAFTGNADDAGAYAFNVRQTYSDGSVVDWSGPADSDEPAARVEAVAELGGGGGGDGDSSTLAIIALILGGIGVLLGGAALLTRGGRSLA
jgi:uncharacterized protein YcnI